jgi:hypothetical protein
MSFSHHPIRWVFGTLAVAAVVISAPSVAHDLRRYVRMRRM